MDTVVDDAGNLYIVGRTTSPSLPGATGGLNGPSDAFLAKYDSSYNHVYTRYLGGSRDDGALGVAVDSQGNVYVVGSTQSDDFIPRGVTNYGTAYSAGTNPLNHEDAFIVKVDASGAPVSARYLGGSGRDLATAVAVYSDTVYMIGYIDTGYDTALEDFVRPDVDGADPIYNAPRESFFAKLDKDLEDYSYFTFLGRGTTAHALVPDSQGAVYLTGLAGDPNALTDAKTYGSARKMADAFVRKVNADGSFGYLTVLGGSDMDWGQSIAIDQQGHVYITGAATASFPITVSITTSITAEAHQAQFNGYIDGFVAKLDGGGELLYSTYLGGSGSTGKDIVVDEQGNAYITGFGMRNYPVGGSGNRTQVRPCFENSTFQDAFVTILNPTGTDIQYSTCIGGGGKEYGSAITRYGGVIQIVGATWSSDLRGLHGTSYFYSGGADLFVATLGESVVITP